MAYWPGSKVLPINNEKSFGFPIGSSLYRRKYRASTRRNGQPGKGPLKLNVREEVLIKLKGIQTNLGEEIISNEEEALIKEIWHQDSI